MQLCILNWEQFFKLIKKRGCHIYETLFLHFSWFIYTGLAHYVSCSRIFWTNSVPVEHRHLITSVNTIIDNVHKQQIYATKVLREQHSDVSVTLCLELDFPWTTFSFIIPN